MIHAWVCLCSVIIHPWLNKSAGWWRKRCLCVSVGVAHGLYWDQTALSISKTRTFWGSEDRMAGVQVNVGAGIRLDQVSEGHKSVCFTVCVSHWHTVSHLLSSLKVHDAVLHDFQCRSCCEWTLPLWWGNFSLYLHHTANPHPSSKHLVGEWLKPGMLCFGAQPVCLVWFFYVCDPLGETPTIWDTNIALKPCRIALCTFNYHQSGWHCCCLYLTHRNRTHEALKHTRAHTHTH